MATAPPPFSRPARQSRREPPPARAPRWRHWLLLGLFFGLSYGLTQRLLAVRWEGSATKAPAFKPKSPPGGTALEELRRQKGEASKPLAADLEELARQQREEKQREEAAKREETQGQNPERDQENEQLGNDSRRLNNLDIRQEPSQQQVPAPTPGAPALPPPVPLPPDQPTPRASQTPSEAPATLP